MEPLIPPAKRGGRQRTVDLREVVNGIFYVLMTGCQWRALPTDLTPKSTVHEYLGLWEWDGTLARLHHALLVEVRGLSGKEASPTAAVIDSPSVKGAEKGGRIDPSGYDAGKKVKGKKRHIVERTFGWLGRCRRLAKDFENLSRMALAFLRLTMTRLMLRRIVRHQKS